MPVAVDRIKRGGNVGVGLEYGFAPNWSVGVEYDHLFMQEKTLAFLPSDQAACRGEAQGEAK
jgi:outer membrane immunogenic protein